MNLRTSFGRTAPLLILVLLAASFSACSSGGGGGTPVTSTNVQLTGTVSTSAGTGYGLKSSRFAAAVGDPSVDQIMAIPMDRGSLTSWNMENSQTSDILADGTFALSLAKTTDWLLVLIDSSVTGTGRFVGSVAMDTGTADSLLNLPVSGSTTTLSAISLGTVSRSSSTSSDAVSSTEVASSDFNMTTAQLATMAKTDDLFRNAMNIVNNYGTYGGAGIWYALRTDFAWTGVSSELTGTAGTNPAMTFKGMSFQLDSNSTNVTLDALCTAKTSTVELYPPAIVTTYSATFSPTAPITSAGCTLSAVNGGNQANGANFYATDQYGGKISYSFSSDLTSIPDGNWLWKENGVLRAAFDVNTVSPPYDAGTKQPKGYVPSFKINFASGSTTQIDSVDIKWFYYDNGTYTEVSSADLAILKHFLSRFEVKFDVTNATTGARKTCEMYLDPATTTQVKPADFSTVTNCSLPWYFNDPTNPDTNTGIMGFYETGGFGYFFHFFPIAPPPAAI